MRWWILTLWSFLSFSPELTLCNDKAGLRKYSNLGVLEPRQGFHWKKRVKPRSFLQHILKPETGNTKLVFSWTTLRSQNGQPMSCRTRGSHEVSAWTCHLQLPSILHAWLWRTWGAVMLQGQIHQEFPESPAAGCPETSNTGSWLRSLAFKATWLEVTSNTRQTDKSQLSGKWRPCF